MSIWGRAHRRRLEEGHLLKTSSNKMWFNEPSVWYSKETNHISLLPFKAVGYSVMCPLGARGETLDSFLGASCVQLLPKPAQRTEKPPVCRVFSCLPVSSEWGNAVSTPRQRNCLFPLKAHWLICSYTNWLTVIQMGGFQDGSARFQTEILSNPAVLRRQKFTASSSQRWEVSHVGDACVSILSYSLLLLWQGRMSPNELMSSTPLFHKTVLILQKRERARERNAIWKGSSLNLKSKPPSIFHPTVKLSICQVLSSGR